MIWRVEIKDKPGIFDAAGAGIGKDILDFGIHCVKEVGVTQVFWIEGDVSQDAIEKICRELLSDLIIQDFSFSSSPIDRRPTPTRCRSSVSDRLHLVGVMGEKGENTSSNLHVIEIAYNPGVMDPVEESTLKGIRDLGIMNVRSVRTAKKYLFYGEISDREINIIVEKILANKLIQHVVGAKDKVGAGFPCPLNETGEETSPLQHHSHNIIQVNILNAKEKTLKQISQRGQLFLNVVEMKAIQKYFKKQGRNPTDCELETIAQTWSEHCNHKTFRGNIRYQFSDNGKKKTKLIRSLFKSTIMKVTKELDKSWCVSVFHDNSGVIEFDKDSNVCFKVETHNHPSALEPFGGANTGIGGVIRDSLGTGLGAKPICNTDVFCFAPPDLPFSRLPKGTLHPKRVMKGVVSGVRDYGNKMGIPTVNGSILFDERFVGNPLVYCGTVGLLPKNRVKKAARTGELIVVVGGRTGRDGIHGATFSSGELTHESEVISSGAVQIGHPIQEKKVLDCLLQARDRNLFSCVTDCGAGGFSSAVGEMGRDLGCRVDLEKAPLKYAGLSYTEIWISESQERMVLSVPKKNIEELLDIFRKENAEASVIGEFTDSKRLELFFYGCQVCDLDLEFLHEGVPLPTKEAVWASPRIKEPRIVLSSLRGSCPERDKGRSNLFRGDCFAPLGLAMTEEAKFLTKKITKILAHYNVCSKEWVIRQYDHEVQGASVIKPLVGVRCDGPSDASVIRPKLGSYRGVAVSNGINARFGMIDPFWMAGACIDEAIRQIISVGGSLERIAILDNFCWGNPDKPDRLGSLVRATEGCYKFALDYGVPFISGKDSLYNEYTVHGKSRPIPGTLLISAIGILDDVRKAVTMDLKEDGNLLYIIGETYDEMGGSIYFDTFDALGSRVPRVDTKKGKKIFEAISKAACDGLIASIHDCSEGGLAVTLAEMAFSGELGATVSLKEVPYRGIKRNDYILFSESNSRFVVEVSPKRKKEFERLLKGISYGLIGNVGTAFFAGGRAQCAVPPQDFIVYGLDGNVCIQAGIHMLKEAWKETLRW